MQTWIYKGNRKANTYLFIENDNDFSRIPEVLLQLMGELQFVVSVNLANRKHLAQADIKEVRQKLSEQGYYIQMPPGDLKPEKLC